MPADLTVVVDADTKPFDRKTGRLGKAGGSLNRGLKTAGTGFIALGAAAVAGLGKGVAAASDLAEAQSKSAQVFGESDAAIQQFAATSVRGFGVSRTAATDFSATLGVILKGSGFAQEAAAGMSVEMVKLAADMASFNNIPVEEALEKIRAGLVGETEPLRTVGVLLSAAAVNEEAYATGIAERGVKLTEAQKVQARYNLILKQTEDTQGDFARTNTGLANSTRIVRATLEDFAIRIGEKFLPLVTEAVARLVMEFDRFSGWFDANEESINAAVKTIGDTAREWLGYFFDGLKSIFDFLTNNKEAMIATLAAIGVAVAAAIGPVGVGGLAILAGIALWGKYKDNLDQLRVDILVALKKIAEVFVTFSVGAARLLIRGFLFLRGELPLLFAEIGVNAAEAMINGILSLLRNFTIPRVETPFFSTPEIKPFSGVGNVDFSAGTRFISGLRGQAASFAGGVDARIAPLEGLLSPLAGQFFDPKIAAARNQLAGNRERAAINVYINEFSGTPEDQARLSRLLSDRALLEGGAIG